MRVATVHSATDVPMLERAPPSGLPGVPVTCGEAMLTDRSVCTDAEGDAPPAPPLRARLGRLPWLPISIE